MLTNFLDLLTKQILFRQSKSYNLIRLIVILIANDNNNNNNKQENKKLMISK